MDSVNRKIIIMLNIFILIFYVSASEVHSQIAEVYGEEAMSR